MDWSCVTKPASGATVFVPLTPVQCCQPGTVPLKHFSGFSLGYINAGFLHVSSAFVLICKKNGFRFAGESLWQLPLERRYRKMIDSPIADLTNYGGVPAGAITAALFLQEFVTSSVQWAHIDAGVFDVKHSLT